MGVPLTQRELCIVIADEPGISYMASNAYADLVGRPLNAIIGHCSEDWLHPDDIYKIRGLRSRALGGNPVSYVRKVVRDGGQAYVSVSLTRLSVLRSELVIAIAWPIVHRSDVAERIEVADYLNDMSRGLATMAATAGLTSLSCHLEDISLEAAAYSQHLAERAVF